MRASALASMIGIAETNTSSSRSTHVCTAPTRDERSLMTGRSGSGIGLCLFRRRFGHRDRLSVLERLAAGNRRANPVLEGVLHPTDVRDFARQVDVQLQLYAGVPHLQEEEQVLLHVPGIELPV